ncbi:hypothetical protein CL614_00505 [archaeon]|nr:hypothetical protein [archaeon]|tara:strand:+ start:1430 stop:1621 length:192 start_codon:yes stop_codon:yes gene_type:complete
MICGDLDQKPINNGVVYGCGRFKPEVTVLFRNGRPRTLHSIPIKTQVDTICKTQRCLGCLGYR